MWQPIRRSHTTRDVRERFVIAPHHRDRLRRPAVDPGAPSDDRFRQALVWNVFRTLELVAPSFWLRRFHLRLTGDASLVAPQIVRVHLWPHLPLPPILRIDGARADVVADVVIETEHVVWTLVTDSPARDVTAAETSAALADAGAWFAGVRQHHCGVIESDRRTPSLGSLLQARYSRSRESARLQSATRGPATPRHVRWGGIDWCGLGAVLEDCCDAASLPPIERALARNALDWLREVGVPPLAPPSRRPAFRIERSLAE
jgi:hypothetical protein